jgi:hypothetical protein
MPSAVTARIRTTWSDGSWKKRTIVGARAAGSSVATLR